MSKARTEDGLRRQQENRARIKKMLAVSRLAPRAPISDEEAEAAKAKFYAKRAAEAAGAPPA